MSPPQSASASKAPVSPIERRVACSTTTQPISSTIPARNLSAVEPPDGAPTPISGASAQWK